MVSAPRPDADSGSPSSAITPILAEQVRVYRPAFLEHGDSPQSTHQNNYATQHLRFETLVAHLLRGGSHNTLEDIGCGICDLYAYLKTQAADVTYSGTEVVPEMVEFARQKYPEIRVINRDIVNESIEDTYDFVVLSGTFNMPGATPHDDWKAFCFAVIRAMYGMCRKAIAFNFLTTHNTFSAPELFYLDPAEATEFCLTQLSRFVELRHAYPLYEGTVTVYRPDYIRTLHQDPALSKYFPAASRP